MTEKNHHIFISYSRDNKDIKDQIVKDLIDYGFDVWVDTESITLTKNWTDEIKRGIESSKILLYLGSPEAKESTYVGYELGYADALNKIIFPIRIKGRSWGDSSPDWYSLVQGMELRGSQYAKRKDKFFKQILQIIYDEVINEMKSKNLANEHIRLSLILSILDGWFYGDWIEKIDEPLLEAGVTSADDLNEVLETLDNWGLLWANKYIGSIHNGFGQEDIEFHVTSLGQKIVSRAKNK